MLVTYIWGREATTEQSLEDWTEAEAWLAKSRAWFGAMDAESKPV